MNENTQFVKDLENQDNAGVNRGMFNLLVSIRDLTLWSKGIKPHRRWKLNPLKEYFGIKGNAESMLAQLRDLKNHLQGGNDNE